MNDNELLARAKAILHDDEHAWRQYATAESLAAANWLLENSGSRQIAALVILLAGRGAMPKATEEIPKPYKISSR